ncbi:hypothetical protein V8G54_006500 [Vigna mungo]|uniref:Pentatricopeptide repeat-containing protein n=1 Tax=Vigna mungo TaxID=3915 RepID=A0AAQ3P3F3_VIGMU
MIMKKRELNNLLSRSLHFLHPKQHCSNSSRHPLPGLLPSDDETSSHDSSLQLSQHYAFLRNSLLNSSTPSGDSSNSSNDAVSMSNAIRTGFGSETQNFLRQFRGKLSESLVVEVMNLVKHPQVCVEFFLWASRQIGYTHTPVVYNALLELLCCNDVNERVSDMFLKQIRDDDRVLLRKLLNFLIQKCCRNGMWNVALEELGRLKDFGYKASPTTYNALIQVFLRADKLDTAYLVQKEMSNSGFFMDGYTLSCFAYSLCKAGRCGDALSLIEKEEFVPDTVFYNRMLSGLCEASRFEEAMQILDRMRLNSCIPNVVTYRTLVSGCLWKGQLGRCKRILSMMMTEGCNPNREMFNSLVHAFCKSRDYSYAYKLFRKMDNCGCQPSYLSYNIFIGSICSNEELLDSDLLELAEKAYSEMLDSGVVLNKINMMLVEGCKPNVVTYTALIDGHCKAGQIDKACQIYARMQGDMECSDMDMYFKLDDNGSETPNIITYGALVDGLCKANRVKEARELLDTMSINGCEPNQIVYDALIDGFCKTGELESAREVFVKMSERGYSPNLYTYSSLINSLFKEKRLDLVLKVLSKMLENSCTPNVVIYTEMIDGLCKVGKADEAYKLMLKMEEVGCYPNVVTYTAMIDGLGKLGKIEQCLELYTGMCSKGCAPNFITYRVLINHCCSAGLLDEAHRLLDEMTRTYWPRHLSSYRKIIEGFNREFVISSGLLDELNENESAPVESLYRILVDRFIKAGRLEVALSLLEEISSSPSLANANKYLYTSLIESLSLANKVDKAFELYASMTNKSVVPELSTFVYLIKGLTRVGRWQEALQLSDSICQMDICWLHEEITVVD